MHSKSNLLHNPRHASVEPCCKLTVLQVASFGIIAKIFAVLDLQVAIIYKAPLAFPVLKDVPNIERYWWTWHRDERLRATALGL